jgi:TPP-dependent pyruvate/acetoin dehydrogenase alpha subunit
MKNFTFRSREAVEAGKALDPVAKATRKLIADGVCTQVEVDAWTAATVREVEDVVAAAKASPYPSTDELLVGTY